MKSSTRVLGLALILLLALTAFPITAGARGLSDITGTQSAQQRHGFDLGRPSVVEHVVPGVTRDSGVTGRRQTVRRRSSGRHYSKKYASGHGRNQKNNSRKSAARTVSQTEDGTTVILSETEPPKHVFISKITPADSSSAKQKDPMQNNKTRRVADILMMGIAGFSIVAALLYVLTAHRNR